MLVLLLALAAHAGSQGTSEFIVDEAGGVAIRIALGAPDVVDLCAIDLARGPEEDARLQTAVERGLPRWLRLTDDEGRPCPVDGIAVRHVGPRVELEAQARCPALPRALRIDWGLFAGTPLDHLSIARLVRPDGTAQLTSFSRRAPRAVLELPRRGASWFIAAIVGASAAIAAASVAFVRARRRRSRRA